MKSQRYRGVLQYAKTPRYDVDLPLNNPKIDTGKLYAMVSFN